MITLFYLLGCSASKTADTAINTEEPVAVWKDYSIQERGPFSVGHTSVEHTYTHMEGAVERTIFIDIWYPTSDQSGDPAAYLYGTDERVFEDAQPAAPGYSDGYPVLVHSPLHTDGCSSRTIPPGFATLLVRKS